MKENKKKINHKLAVEGKKIFRNFVDFIFHSIQIKAMKFDDDQWVIIIVKKKKEKKGGVKVVNNL